MRNAARSPRRPRQHGLLYNLVWGLASGHWWGLILSSLLLSLLIEYAGMTFFWSEEGGGAQPRCHEHGAGLAVNGVHPQSAAFRAGRNGAGVDFRRVSVAVCGQWHADMAACTAGGDGGRAEACLNSAVS